MTQPTINERFARFMRERLRATNEGNLPSVSVLAARFNHVDNWQRPVAAETMRRWLRGLSLPELSRLPALCRLLACSPMDIVEALGFADMLAAPAGTADGQPPPSDHAQEAVCNELRAQVVQIMRGMDEPRLRAMVSLFERRTQPRA